MISHGSPEWCCWLESSYTVGKLTTAEVHARTANKNDKCMIESADNPFVPIRTNSRLEVEVKHHTPHASIHASILFSLRHLKQWSEYEMRRTVSKFLILCK